MSKGRRLRPRRQMGTKDRTVPLPLFGGFSAENVLTGGATLGMDLRNAALAAQKRAHDGAPLAEVLQVFLGPLMYVYKVMDRLGDALKANPPAPLAPACAAGCFFCCRLYVEVGPWEAFAMAAYVAQIFDEADPAFCDHILAKLRATVASHSARGHATVRHGLCTFLGRNGQCGIYPVRPASCHSYYSSSRSACETYFSRPDLEGTHPTVVAGPDRGITNMLNFAEVHATASPPFAPTAGPPLYELESAVLRILETPDALVRYLHGEDIFYGCVGVSPPAALQHARTQLSRAMDGAMHHG